ncbi:MAG: htrA, partial [Chlamydiia bacterium]|nr:htrA [Chlamydiia bacterium]
IAEAFGIPKAEGALITDVVKDGPADKAGLKPGDVVIKLNKQEIKNVGILRNGISFLHPAEVATLTILRGGKEMEIPVTIGLHPENELNAQEIQKSLGLLVEELTPEIRQQLGVIEEKGVVIKYISPNSIAQYAGLRRGQLILSVNRSPIRSTEEFYQAIREKSTGDQILLHVKEGQGTRFVILHME